MPQWHLKLSSLELRFEDQKMVIILFIVQFLGFIYPKTTEYKRKSYCKTYISSKEGPAKSSETRQG